MGGGEKTQEHRKVEAVGVGWESTPSPPPESLRLGSLVGRAGSSPRQERVGSSPETGPRGERASAHRMLSSLRTRPSGPAGHSDVRPGVLGPSLASPWSLWVSVLSSIKSGWASGPGSTNSQVWLTTTKLVSRLKCRIQLPACYPPSRKQTYTYSCTPMNSESPFKILPALTRPDSGTPQPQAGRRDSPLRGPVRQGIRQQASFPSPATSGAWS